LSPYSGISGRLSSCLFDRTRVAVHCATISSADAEVVRLNCNKMMRKSSRVGKIQANQGMNDGKKYTNDQLTDYRTGRKPDYRTSFDASSW
jgi:hypothetical protein